MLPIDHYSAEYRAKKHIVVEYPGGRWVDKFMTAEMAQGYALACNLWLETFPEPHIIFPFFRRPAILEMMDLEEKTTYDRLISILDKSLIPDKQLDDLEIIISTMVREAA